MTAPLPNPAEFSLPLQHLFMLREMGTPLEPGQKVLDFGCGTGKHVYEYRDRGFDAYGFDIVKELEPRPGEDCERFFRFSLTGATKKSGDTRFDPVSYKVPFEDASFDFVFSTEVLEHVMDHALVFAEIARILKKGGASIHTFPARSSLIESHFFTPLGGVIHSYPWHLVFAILGVKNQFQASMTPAERARHNLNYLRTGLNYRKTSEILSASRRHFATADLIPHLFERNELGYRTRQGILLEKTRLYRSLYTTFHRVVLFLRKA